MVFRSVDGALRLVDAVLGTSLDLPQSQMQFMKWMIEKLKIDPRSFGLITSTGFLPAALRQFFALSPASDPEAIEYVSARGSYSIKEGDIPNFRKTKDQRFYASAEFRASEFDRSFDNVMKLLNKFGKKNGDFNDINKAVQWLNESIAPFKEFKKQSKDNDKIKALLPSNWDALLKSEIGRAHV